MIVRCSKCRSSYSVDDTKVRNKKFAFQCPKCETENIIDNRPSVPDIDAPMPIHAHGTGTVSNDFTFSEDTGRARTELTDNTPRIMDAAVSGNDLELDDALLSADDDLGMSDDIDEITNTRTREKKKPRENEDVPLDDINTNINLDDIDIDIASEDKTAASDDLMLDDSEFIQDELESPPPAGKARGTAVSDELSDEIQDTPSGDDNFDDINIDDILIPESDEEPARKKSKSAEDRGDILDLENDLITDDDELKIDDASLEIDDTIETQSFTLDEAIDAGDRKKSRNAENEEDLALDLDSLDIELNGDEELMKEVRKGTVHHEPPRQDARTAKKPSDDDLTLDLDSLDIELEESGMIMEGEQPDDVDMLDSIIDDKKPTSRVSTKKAPDDDLTLDLDSLDISLEETDEVMQGETPDEDEKLTLQDAGLTLEELTTDEISNLSDEKEEEDIKLTLDEIDPSLSGDLNELTSDEIDQTLLSEEEEDIKLNINEIDPSLSIDDIHTEIEDEFPDDIMVDDIPSRSGKKSRAEEARIIDEIEELPDVELGIDETDQTIVAGAGAAVVAGGTAIAARRGRDRMFDEELMDIDLDRQEIDEEEQYSKKKPLDASVKGSVSLSIDYSIKYSRIGALLRMFGLILFALIPHFVVLFIYTILSVILGFLNHLIVLIRGEAVEDFSQIEENTVRYFLSVYSSMIGMVEDLPSFAGKDNIDYPLQMKVIYPFRSSRLLAAMRLSIAGILLLLFPHILIAGVLSLVIPLMFIAGVIAVLVSGRWPSLLFDFFNRYYRYCAKILCFGTGIVDEYPSFRFD
jgi:hypothetical protein